MKAIKGSAGVYHCSSEDEDTPKHKQVRGEVDLKEADPLPLETKEGRTKMTKEKVIQRSQVSRPVRSPRLSTVNRKRIKNGAENALAKTNPPTKEAARAITNGNTLMTKHVVRARTNSSKQSAPTSTHLMILEK